MFGVVGGVAGAVTGEDRNANACLDCGTSWRAADLYKTLQIIENITDTKLDLAYEEDRNFINDFINEINPYIEKISKAEKNERFVIKKSKDELATYPATFFLYAAIWYLFGFGIYLTLFVMIAAVIGGYAIIVLFISFPFVKKTIDKLKDQEIKKEKASFEIKNRKAIREAVKLKIDAKQDLKYEIENFMDRHS
ncbi:MAG: hypothetical protein AAGE84_10060 [Cyanobacteria bacterium P01_G01_bin.39]